MKKKIILLSGITGVGKSDISQILALKLKTDVIVGDSLQVFERKRKKILSIEQYKINEEINPWILFITLYIYIAIINTNLDIQKLPHS